MKNTIDGGCCLVAGRGALMAPAALQHMRYSVLHCIRQLGEAAQESTVWKSMTDKVAEVVIVYLDGSQTAAVQEAAAQVSDMHHLFVQLECCPRCEAYVVMCNVHWQIGSAKGYWQCMPPYTNTSLSLAHLRFAPQLIH